MRISKKQRPQAFRSAIALTLLMGAFGFSPDRMAATSLPGPLALGYRWDTWGTREGLPSSAVQTMVQTLDGYLWVGVQDGLVRFDGSRFTVFDEKDIPGIGQLSVNALFEGRDGTLWIGCDGAGLLALKGGVFTRYTTASGLAADTVNSIIQDPQGNIWVATTRGLSRLSGKKFISYTVKDGLSDDWVETLYRDHRGIIWAGTVHGLSRVENATITSVTLQTGKTEVDAIGENASGMWLGTDHGLLLLRDGALESYAAKMGPAVGRVRALFEDRNGDLWIGTGGTGLFRLQGETIQQVTSDGAFGGMTVLGVNQDHEGSLWLGTWGDGLIRLSEEKIKTFGPSLNVAYQSSDGSIWGGANGQGLLRIKDGQTTLYTTKQGLSSNLIISLWEDSSGSLWIGTDGGGLNRFRNGKFAAYGSREGLAASTINCIYADQQDRIWVGTTSNGLQSLEDGRFVPHPLPGEISGAVRFLLEDKDQSLWVGTDSGLAHSRGMSRTEFDFVPGFSKDAVMYIHQDSDGVLWVGTQGNGLKRLRNGRVTTYTRQNGLFDDVIWAIVEDKGVFWMTSDKGVSRVTKSDLNDFAEGKAHSVKSVTYGIGDGLKTIEFNGGMQPSGFKTDDGKLLFPGAKGFVVMDPARLRPRTDPPTVLMERVTVNGEQFSLDRPALVKPGTGAMEFEYTAIDLLAPEGMTFRYRLQPFDRDWVDVGSRRTAFYTNIQPGKYEFRVTACNRDGVCNAQGAPFFLVLKAHFYQTFWFFLMCGFLLCLLALGGHRLRVRRLQARELELALRVEERTTKLNAEVAERKRAEDALKLASSQLQLILNSVFVGICGFGLDGTAMFANPSAARITGWRLAEMAGKSAHDLFHARMPAGSAHQEHDCQMGATLRDGVVRDMQQEVFWRKDGSSFPVEYTTTPIWEGSRLTGAVMTFKDVSARRNVEDALHRHSIELERSNADLEQFAYVASHDLQEPLRMVASFTQLLAVRYKHQLDTEAQEYIGFAVEGATRMQALIEGLLSFARVKTRAKALEPTDCQAVLDRVLRNLGVALQESKAQVTSDPLPTVNADESQMELLLQNLVANAVKFRGKEPPRVHVAAERNGTEWVFSVADNGIGINPAYKERIFGMFQRLHARTAYPGTGIGLAICKKIVERHGGRIWVESEDGRGATFRFTMPALDDQEQPSISPDDPQEQVKETLRHPEPTLA